MSESGGSGSVSKKKGSKHRKGMNEMIELRILGAVILVFEMMYGLEDGFRCGLFANQPR